MSIAGKWREGKLPSCQLLTILNKAPPPFVWHGFIRQQRGNTMNTAILMIALTALGLTSGFCHAEYSKCEIDGVLVYSDTKCNNRADAEEIVIHAPPRDSADNPEGAANIQMRKESEAQMELQRQQLQLERDKAQAQYDLQRQQMKMQQDLVDNAKGYDIGATWGASLTPTQSMRQAGAVKALKAINGVVDIPDQRQTTCNGQSFNSNGYGHSRTVCR
jgi:hypothetical protein